MSQTDSLLSCSSLDELLPRPEVLVLDTTWSARREGPGNPRSKFEAAHLPGARFFDFEAARDKTSHLHDKRPEDRVLERYLQVLGANPESHIVCYSQGSFSGAARIWWLLRSLGHQRVSILDGGLQEWEERQLPLESGPEAPCARGTFQAHVSPGEWVQWEAMREAQGRRTQTIDGRPQDVYQGARDFFATRASPATGVVGHMPGSINIPTATLLQDGLLLDGKALRAHFSAKGVDLEERIITTCSLGVAASALAFALHLAGARDVGVYDGSWEEWAARDGQH